MRLCLSVGVSTLAMVAMMSAPGVAQAQSRQPTDPAHPNVAPIVTDKQPTWWQKGEKDTERMVDSYKPKGIDFGNFLLFPKVEFDQKYNSNVFAEETNTNSDFISIVRPQFTLKSQFPVHYLQLDGRVEYYKYWKYSEDDHFDTSLDLFGRYDLQRNWEITTRNNLISQMEDRGSDDAVNGKYPTRVRGFSSRLGTKYQEGDIILASGIQVERRVYGDVETSLGSTINNSDRDNWAFEYMARAGYEFFKDYAAIAQVTYNTRDYDQAVDDLGFRRSSDGYTAEVGIAVDISQLVRGDFLVGYMKQDYRDDNLRDPSGLSIRASFTWTPSKMTIVVPTVERKVYDATLANVGGRVRTAGNVMVRHEWARNVLLTGFAGVAHDEYVGLDRSAMSYDVNGRVTYSLTPELYVGGEVGFRSRDSELAGASFDQYTIGLRLGLQL